jgi:nucleotidyltransferase substrate binding protein (TIGR01987 family)
MASKQFSNFENALIRLNEVLARDAADDIVRDAAIQRFEFTFEACWKAIKHQLATLNVTTGSPRDVIEKAGQRGWIPNERLWGRIIEDRNRTSHLYQEALARSIFERLSSYREEFERVRVLLRESQGDV